MPSQPHPQDTAYPLIDALRAFAALLVVGYHVIAITPWDARLTPGILKLFHMGWIGVDCFLVISGFVITLSALRDRERDPAGFHRGFAIRRLGRIAPLYFLTSVVFVLFVNRELLSTPASHQALQYVTHLLFVHNLNAGTAGAINGPSWSIGLEMQFYVLIMITLPWLSRARIKWVLLVMFVVALGYRYLITKVLPPGAAHPHLQQVYTAQLPGTLDAFGLGIAFGLAVARGRGLLARWLVPNMKNFLAWTFVALVLSVVCWKIFWPRANYWYLTSMILFWRFALAVTFACWLASAITCPAAAHAIFRPVRYLGTVSYGIYLWHIPVLLTLMKVPDLSKNHGVMMFGTIGIAIALASLSWHFFEKPLLQRAKRWAAEGRQRPHTQAALKA